MPKTLKLNECYLTDEDKDVVKGWADIMDYANGDISKWDVSNVWDMDYVFANSKFSQDVSKWDTSKVEDMTDVFEKCPIKEEYKPEFKKNYGGWA